METLECHCFSSEMQDVVMSLDHVDIPILGAIALWGFGRSVGNLYFPERIYAESHCDSSVDAIS